MAKQSDTFNFDVLADFLVGPADGKSRLRDDNTDNFQDIDPDDLSKKLSGDQNDDDDDKKDNDDKTKIDISKTDDDKTDDDKNDKDDNKKDNDKSNIDPDDVEYISEISTFVGKELATKLGLDIEDDIKFESIEDVIDLMSQVVEENSKPVFSSDEVEKYNEFVKNGGSLREFYNEMYSGKLNIDKVDIDNEFDQRAIIKEYLVNQGVKEDKIKRMLDRYSETETLKEEAEDALDLLKEYNQKKAESLLREKENERREFEKKQQKFQEDVNKTIKTISNIGGLQVSEKEKRELLEYAFMPEKDGLTKFQKDYAGSTLNMLETAFYLKNRHKFAENVKKQTNTDAYKVLLDKYKAKGKIDNKDQKSSGSSLGDFGKGIIFN